ncbi:hypothetical protein Tco_0779465 [Tanacetum coccineum]
MVNHGIAIVAMSPCGGGVCGGDSFGRLWCGFGFLAIMAPHGVKGCCTTRPCVIKKLPLVVVTLGIWQFIGTTGGGTSSVLPLLVGMHRSFVTSVHVSTTTLGEEVYESAFYLRGGLLERHILGYYIPINIAKWSMDKFGKNEHQPASNDNFPQPLWTRVRSGNTIFLLVPRSKAFHHSIFQLTATSEEMSRVKLLELTLGPTTGLTICSLTLGWVLRQLSMYADHPLDPRRRASQQKEVVDFQMESIKIEWFNNSWWGPGVLIIPKN